MSYDPNQPYNQQPYYGGPQQPQAQPPKKTHTVRNVILIVVGALVLVAIISGIVGGGNSDSGATQPAVKSAAPAPVPSSSAPQAPQTSSAPAPKPTHKAKPAPQSNSCIFKSHSLLYPTIAASFKQEGYPLKKVNTNLSYVQSGQTSFPDGSVLAVWVFNNNCSFLPIYRKTLDHSLAKTGTWYELEGPNWTMYETNESDLQSFAKGYGWGHVKQVQ